MSLISLPYTFQAGTTIASAQVNANFNAIVNVVNGNLDGTNFSTIFTSLNTSAAKGHASFAGGFVLQWGQTTGVAFDNSGPTAVTFDIAFPTACFGVNPTIPENTSNTQALVVPYAYADTVTGFNLIGMGGKLTTTGTVYWIAWGY